MIVAWDNRSWIRLLDGDMFVVPEQPLRRLYPKDLDEVRSTRPSSRREARSWTSRSACAASWSATPAFRALRLRLFLRAMKQRNAQHTVRAPGARRASGGGLHPPLRFDPPPPPALPPCGITDTPSVRDLLAHLGEPTAPVSRPLAARRCADAETTPAPIPRTPPLPTRTARVRMDLTSPRYYSGTSRSRVGTLRGKTWLEAAWLLAFRHFGRASELASCLDGQFSKATAATLGRVRVPGVSSAPHGARRVR